MRLFDGHCHMQDAQLAPDLMGALARASKAGVERMLCCGTTESDWPLVAGLCSRHNVLSPAYGLHPWHIHERSADWLNVLTGLLVSQPGAAVGEIGLDHAIRERNYAEQAEVFTAQLRLSQTLNRPACIHCRKAWGSLPRILKELGGLSAGFLIHSYSGPVEDIAPLVQLGAYFSFSGSITRHRNRRGHAAASAVPLDRLLLETDSPDLPPVLTAKADNGMTCASGKPNEPANLVHVLRKVAELRKISEEQAAESSWANACRLFGIH